MKTLKCYLLTLCKGGTAAFCAAFVCIMSPKLGAASATAGLDQVFGTQSVAPKSTTTPWVQAIFQDNGDGTVNLTINNPNLTGVEDVGTFYFNFNDAKNVGALQFSIVSQTGTFDSSSLSYSLSSSLVSSQKADGDGYYDVVINGFATGQDTTKTFGVGDSLTLKISSTQGSISFSDFNFTSDGGTTAYYAAAHVMNTCTQSNKGAYLGGSSFTVAPESYATGFGAGLVALFASLPLLSSQKRTLATAD